MDSKTYIITGSNGEIGIAICKHLCDLGHRVLAVTRRPHDFTGVLANRPINVVVPQIYDEKLVHDVFVQLAREGEKVDGMVYGAAIFHRFNNLLEISAAEWEEVFRVNVLGAFIWARALSESLKARHVPGAIVNITSQAAFTGGYGGVVPYASSKGALTTMTRSLARELASHEIRVNAIAPGFIETDAMRGTLDEQKLAAFHTRVPMRRFGTVDEVAKAVEFLLSDASNYITGATLDVTGGQLMH
jgi:3-oxoacyl-[acyl-carrier protein] reductase